MTLRMKEWLAVQGEREGVAPHVIYMRLARGGWYPQVVLHRENRRVIYVEEPPAVTYRSTPAFAPNAERGARNAEQKGRQ